MSWSLYFASPSWLAVEAATCGAASPVLPLGLCGSVAAAESLACVAFEALAAFALLAEPTRATAPWAAAELGEAATCKRSLAGVAATVDGGGSAAASTADTGILITVELSASNGISGAASQAATCERSLAGVAATGDGGGILGAAETAGFGAAAISNAATSGAAATAATFELLAGPTAA